MLRRLLPVLALPALVCAAEGMPPAERFDLLSFEVGIDMANTKDWGNANGQFFALNVPTKGVTLGYFYESTKGLAESNDNGGTATKVDAALTFHEIRVLKTIPATSNTLDLGVGVGAGEFKTTNQGGAQTSANAATVGDVFLKFTPISGGEKVKGALNLTAGYRFVRFSAVDADGAATDFSDTVDNMDALHFGLSAEFGF